METTQDGKVELLGDVVNSAEALKALGLTEREYQ